MNRLTWLIGRLSARQLMAIALVLLVGWCSGFQFSAMTPAGKQCPTASVQTVSVAVKSDCGHVVGYEQRAPQPGEEGFHQCRCAENKAGEMRDSLLAVSAIDLPSQALICPILPIPPVESKIPDLATDKLVSEPSPPEARPPAVA